MTRSNDQHEAAAGVNKTPISESPETLPLRDYPTDRKLNSFQLVAVFFGVVTTFVILLADVLALAVGR